MLQVSGVAVPPPLRGGGTQIQGQTPVLGAAAAAYCCGLLLWAAAVGFCCALLRSAAVDLLWGAAAAPG